MTQTKRLALGQTKNDGIALPLAFLTSMFVLILALYTLNSISRSFQRTVGIERSNKVFFASESGVEAALFHKKSRGKGTHFDWESWNSGDVQYNDWLKTVRLNHVETATEARWKLESRFIPSSPGNLVYNGSVKEFQSIEIPLYYDSAMLPTDPESTNNGLKGNTIVMTFPGNIVPNTFDFGDNRTVVSPNTFPVDNNTQKKERLLIDWSLSRFDNGSGVQTFVPDTNLGNPCWNEALSARSVLFCETEASSGSDKAITLNNSAITGAVEPCSDAAGTGCHLITNLQQFFSAGPTVSNFKLRLQSLLPYEDSDSGSKIAQIPFTITLPNDANDLPQSEYKITSLVTKGDYTKETSFVVDESAGIGAFNYVIFE